MKIAPTLALFALASLTSAPCAEPEKSPFKVEVKRHLLEADSGRTHGGDSRTKIYTLRVQITNITREPVEGCTLSGEALVKRSVGDKEKLVKESIAAVPVPALKGGAEITIDLGKITVRKIEWKHREFEESVEEWKVVCTKAGKEIAGHQSSPDFTAQAKDATEVHAKPDKARQPGNNRERPLRRLMER